MRRFVVALLGLAVAAGCQAPSPRSNHTITAVSLEYISTGLSVGPEYLVTLEAGGRVTFEWRGFSARKGETLTKKISPAKVTPVFARAEQLHFETLRNRYEGGDATGTNGEGLIVLVPTDLPTQVVTVIWGSKSKRVEDYFEPPTGLRELERLINETADIADWLKRR